MPWRQLVPANTGGGRTREAPAGKLYSSGQFTLNAAALALLGSPDRATVAVWENSDGTLMPLFRMQPTTPDDRGGFSVAGGGNTPARFSCRALVTQHPALAGDYEARRVKGGIELKKAGAS